MLSKKNRAGKKELDKVFQKGKFINSPTLTFKFLLEASTVPPRISFIVPKSVARLAVKRNALRRRGYATIQGHWRGLPAGLLGAFIFKKYPDDAQMLKNEIKAILSKIH